MYYFWNVSNSELWAAEQGVPFDDDARVTVGTAINSNSVAAIHTPWHPQGNLNFTNPQDYHAGTHLTSLYLVNRRGVIMHSHRSDALNNINGWAPGSRAFSIR